MSHFSPGKTTKQEVPHRFVKMSTTSAQHLEPTLKLILINCESAGKWGSVFTVTIMMVGCILLTLTGIGLSGRQMTIWYIIAQVS